MKETVQQKCQRKEEHKTLLLNYVRHLHTSEARCRSMEDALTRLIEDVRSVVRSCEEIASEERYSIGERRAWKSTSVLLKVAANSASIKLNE